MMVDFDIFILGRHGWESRKHHILALLNVPIFQSESAVFYRIELLCVVNRHITYLICIYLEIERYNC